MLRTLNRLSDVAVLLCAESVGETDSFPCGFVSLGTCQLAIQSCGFAGELPASNELSFLPCFDESSLAHSAFASPSSRPLPYSGGSECECRARKLCEQQRYRRRKLRCVMN